MTTASRIYLIVAACGTLAPSLDRMVAELEDARDAMQEYKLASLREWKREADHSLPRRVDSRDAMQRAPLMRAEFFARWRLPPPSFSYYQGEWT